MLLSLSFNSVRLSITSRRDLQSVPTRKRPHAKSRRYECINFALKAAQLLIQLTKVSVVDCISIQSPFLVRHLVQQRRTAPHRAARRKRQATDAERIGIDNQCANKKSFKFSFFAIDEIYRQHWLHQIRNSTLIIE